MQRSLITLLTDFGTTDYYVAAVKAAVLSVNPDVDFVDITHQIPPHDIYAGAFALRGCYATFPPRTIHLAVVDPGVGSARRPILVEADRYSFIGPDNGIFSYVYQAEKVSRVIHLSASHYYRTPVSSTFHGRDIFAPCAAWLAKGIDPLKMGELITDYARFNLPQAQVNGNQINGHIIHVDRFGNCVTNINSKIAPADALTRGMHLLVANRPVTKFVTHYAAAAPNELFAYYGSADLLEIALPQNSAQRLLEAKRGMEVVLRIKPS